MQSGENVKKANFAPEKNMNKCKTKMLIRFGTFIYMCCMYLTFVHMSTNVYTLYTVYL